MSFSLPGREGACRTHYSSRMGLTGMRSHMEEQIAV